MDKLNVLREDLSEAQANKNDKTKSTEKVSQFEGTISNLKVQINEVSAELLKLERKKGPKSKSQKLDSRDQESRDQWAMIQFVQEYLLGFATIDLVLQVLI